jgi:hypothetical protein
MEMAKVNRISEEQALSNVHPKLRVRIQDVQQNAVIENGVIRDGNGNDVSHLVKLAPNVKPASPYQRQALRDKDDMAVHSDENGGFVMAMFKAKQTHDHRFVSLTQQDLARLMFIGTYVTWQTGRLQRGKHIIRKKDLQDMLVMSTKRFNEFFKKLINEDIISEVKETGEIFVNPTVFYRGDVKNHPSDIRDYDYTRVFRKTVRELYEQYNGRKLGQLAIVYSVLPFLNFDSNVVCYNPEETDLTLLRPMPVSKLAVLLGYKDPHKLTVALRGVKLGDQPVFTFAHNPRNYKEKRIVVNPRVVFAGNGEELNGLKVLFN